MAIRLRKTGVAISVLILIFLGNPPNPFVAGQTIDKNKTYPRQVLLIRHAEKPPEEANSVDLTPEGKKRAEALHLLFEASQKRPNPFPTPDFIFAAKNTERSQRPLQTVTPLANKLKRAIVSDYKTEDFPRLVNNIFQNPKYAGKTILICWRHSKIPQLAHEFQAATAPDTWQKAVFDRVWQITFDEQGKATYRDLPQQLLAGDSEK